MIVFCSKSQSLLIIWVFFEFELCDSPDISEECFRERRLLRSNCDPDVEGELQCRRWWKPLKQEELSHYSLTPQGYPDDAPYLSGCSFVSFATYYDLPEDVDCTHCVLRWHYVTTNSCTSDDSAGEEFWNCADVSISAPDGQSTTDTSPAEGYASMNERLTAKVPEDLTNLMVEGVDNWRCPNPAYGTYGEYFCGSFGEVDGTDGCYAAQQGETCTISFYESSIEPVQEGIPDVSYCTWSGVCLEDGVGGSDWCDYDEANCDSCGGQWCLGWDSIEHSTGVATAFESSTTFRDTTAVPMTSKSLRGFRISENPTYTVSNSAASTNLISDSDGDIIAEVSDISAELQTLINVISNIRDFFDGSKCVTSTTNAASSVSSSLAATLLLERDFSGETDFENEWTLVSDTGIRDFQSAGDGLSISVGESGTGTYAYSFVPKSNSYRHFMISATGMITSGADANLRESDSCRLEVSSDSGETWYYQPVLTLDMNKNSASETLAVTVDAQGLVLRWMAEGHSCEQICTLHSIHVQGLGNANDTPTFTDYEQAIVTLPVAINNADDSSLLIAEEEEDGGLAWIAGVVVGGLFVISAVAVTVVVLVAKRKHTLSQEQAVQGKYAQQSSRGSASPAPVIAYRQ